MAVARGFAKMKAQGRGEEVRRIARVGGESSPTKFRPGDPRAREAGRKGGQTRANDPEIKSGRLGRLGAHARWGSDE